ncbi:MAG TPA: glycine cleavage system aminomethyltransferase GcvT [Methylocella sp.]|nr:glycine cleavage system aminomethyltransferase GcvT [Methylocella sp.]
MSASLPSAARAASRDLARTPLDALHRSLGARMIEFAGYALPVQYPSGIISEHLHTRARASLFDVSHMGQAVLAGLDAARRLESLVPADITGLAPGRIRYTQFLDSEGHFLDDLMVTRIAGNSGDERFRLVVNAAFKAADFAHLQAHLPDCALTILEDQALLAFQGPFAARILARCLPPAYSGRVMTMPFMSAIDIEQNGIAMTLSRSGYTGEDGFEISLPGAMAESFARKLLSIPDVRPAGLGARNSLRLEAGLCLSGHDIDATTGPVEAGLLWSIPRRRRKEGGFLGYEGVKRALERGPALLRTGFLMEGKVSAREGAMVLDVAGQAAGRITSGSYAPSLGRAIAMGYAAPEHAVPGTQLRVTERGKEIAAAAAPMPFVPHRYFRGVL